MFSYLSSVDDNLLDNTDNDCVFLSVNLNHWLEDHEPDGGRPTCSATSDTSTSGASLNTLSEMIDDLDNV